MGELDSAFSAGIVRCTLQPYTSRAVPRDVVHSGEGRGHWRTFDAVDGLAENEVWPIAQDTRGNIWFGSENGATRYDGESFTHFTEEDGLGHNCIFSILCDSQGHLWFGTFGGGASRYDGETFTNFTVENGLASNAVSPIYQDRDGCIWFGSGLLALGDGTGVTRYDGETFTNFTVENGLAHDSVQTIYQDRDGYLWFGTFGGGVSRYDGEIFVNFTTEDGLTSDWVLAVCQDQWGDLWFGTMGGGASRYDGKSFSTVTVGEGLPHPNVYSILLDRTGDLWFGCQGGGVSRYDGKSFTTFTTDDGLGNNSVPFIYQDQEGYLWFSTYGGGVSQYDGETIVTFSTDGFVSGIAQESTGDLWVSVHNGIYRFCPVELGKQIVTRYTPRDGMIGRCIHRDRMGRIWIGTFGGDIVRYDGVTWDFFSEADGLTGHPLFDILEDSRGHFWFCSQAGGVTCYDGESFTSFTTADGLAHDDVRCVLEDRDGNLWFGTYGGGLSRYSSTEEGEQAWTTLTNKDGLASNVVREGALFQDRVGNIWIGTLGGGVSRYDGESFTTYTTTDGLAHDDVRCILEDRDGTLWFGTSGGVSRYDGLIFQTLTQGDGLADNSVRSIFEDRDGYLWFGTTTGITRFSPSVPFPPPVFIDAAVADQRYEGEQALSVLQSRGLTAVEFHGMSMKTRPEAMVYRYRLRGHDDEWRNTHRRRVEYQNLPVGDYTFEVIAVDRDLAYSEQPATLSLTVMPDPRDEQIDELEGRVKERTQELEETHRRLEAAQAQLIDELEAELQTAHDMQMGLMPKEAPQTENLDISGRCLPANHVGGDFFQYFLQGGKLSIGVADVTGHAMEAAIPVVMFNGILESQMELGGTLEDLFARLNRSLYRTRINNRTFVCFTMAELDLSTHNLRLANGAGPYPLHFRADTSEVVELQVDAYPLGVRANTEYSAIEMQLAFGDAIIFYSDGIPEASNAKEEMFGFGRTANIVRQACAENLSAEELIDRLINSVKGFTGDAPQMDDMTVVVMKIEKVDNFDKTLP
ncbi:MAG: SpoIIE family protein phosphatase [Gemmatimonadetes bacterium]|nr:SpoIIE family protein phosphatase [Gemmatimonadota bacterium]